MKTWIPLVAMASLGMPWVAVGQHEHQQHQASGGTTVGTAEAGKAAHSSVLQQTTCPVTGKAINQNVFTTYQGQKVFFCSTDCISKFRDAPGKYLPALYNQWYPQTVQVKCPVMGDPVDGKTFVDVQGKHIALCCNDCPKKVNADPAKYLAKMKQVSTDQVHCPVTGKAIDPQNSFDYQGKAVYFSNADALAKFKAEPAKYAATLRPEAGLAARGATAEEDLILTLAPGGNADVGKRQDLKTTVYQGRTYFLRGDGGLKTFQANPAQYAKALEVEMKKRSTVEKTPASGTGTGAMSHEGHTQGNQSGAHSGHQH